MNSKQKAREVLRDARRCRLGDDSCTECDILRVDALDAAGLLRTGREAEVMCRLTTTAMGSDLMGQRLGVRSDFVTPAMDRAVEALSLSS